MAATVLGLVREQCISAAGDFPSASSALYPVRRVKPSFTQVIRRATSVKTTPFEVRLAASDSCSNSAPRSCIS